MDKDSLYNPFEDALKGFKAEKTMPENSDREESIPEKEAENGLKEKAQEISILKAEEAKIKKENQEKEDKELHGVIVKMIGVSEKDNPKKFWGILHLIQGSRLHDVSYEVDRWLTRSVTNPLDRNRRGLEIVEKILKRGYESEALAWLRSATAEGTEYGRKDQTKDDRVEEAARWARKSGLHLWELAEKYKFDLKKTK